MKHQAVDYLAFSHSHYSHVFDHLLLTQLRSLKQQDQETKLTGIANADRLDSVGERLSEMSEQRPPCVGNWEIVGHAVRASKEAAMHHRHTPTLVAILEECQKPGGMFRIPAL